MTTYQICDNNGYALVDGISDRAEAERIAQRRANDRGASVWLSETDDQDMGEEIEPEPATDEQIQALADEAAAANDLDQMYIALRALGQTLEPRDHDGGLAMGMTQAEARAECERVIREAQARAEN